MKRYLFTFSLLVVSCTVVEYENPYDPKSGEHIYVQATVDTLNFGFEESALSFYVVNTGNTVWEWNADKDRDWIELDRQGSNRVLSGDSIKVDVSVNRDSMVFGTSSGTISINSLINSDVIDVSVDKECSITPQIILFIENGCKGDVIAATEYMPGVNFTLTGIDDNVGRSLRMSCLPPEAVVEVYDDSGGSINADWSKVEVKTLAQGYCAQSFENSYEDDTALVIYSKVTQLGLDGRVSHVRMN